MKEQYEELTVKYFNLSPRSRYYSKDWERVQVLIDHETKEIVTRYKSRWNSTYDKEERVKL